MVRTSRTQAFTKLRQEHHIYIPTEEDIGGYPIPQFNVELGKYRITGIMLKLTKYRYCIYDQSRLLKNVSILRVCLSQACICYRSNLISVLF